MTPNVYEAALIKAKLDMIEAINQRDRLNLEIARLQQLVASLTATINPGAKEDVGSDNVGFTELVLGLVNRTSAPVTPTHIKQSLELSGFSLKHYSNPLALIHQTLKRLSDQGKIHELEGGNYKRHSLYELAANELAKPRPQERFKLDHTKGK